MCLLVMKLIIIKKVAIIKILKELKEKREYLLNDIEGLLNRIHNLKIEKSNNYERIKILKIELGELEEELEELDKKIEIREKNKKLIPKKVRNKVYQNER